MMAIVTLVAVLTMVCCPPTIPMWLFVLPGFHLGLRKQLRADWIRRHGHRPEFGTWDWFKINC